MAWRIAKSLEKLRTQVNARWPKRDKSSDGTIGDAAHASRSSDHNPWVKDGKTGVVTGMDITNDPTGGPVSNDLAEALRASRDTRIKYIISNARICSGDAGPSPWVWRKYSGSNAHRKHVHLSVKSDKAHYDSVKPWKIGDKFVEPVARVYDAENDVQPAHPPVLDPVVVDAEVKGDPELYSVQKRLKAMNYNPGVLDGRWGGGTSGALGGFINDRGGKIAVPASLDAFNDTREEIKAELSRAESQSPPFTRPVSAARKAGDAATVAAVAPEVVPVKQNFWLAMWGSIGATFTAIWTQIKDYVSAAWDWFTDNSDSGIISTISDWISQVPTVVWILAAAAALGWIAINSRVGVNKITESVQSGERL